MALEAFAVNGSAPSSYLRIVNKPLAEAAEA